MINLSQTVRVTNNLIILKREQFLKLLTKIPYVYKILRNTHQTQPTHLFFHYHFSPLLSSYRLLSFRIFYYRENVLTKETNVSQTNQRWESMEDGIEYPNQISTVCFVWRKTRAAYHCRSGKQRRVCLLIPGVLQLLPSVCPVEKYLRNMYKWLRNSYIFLSLKNFSVVKDSTRRMR